MRRKAINLKPISITIIRALEERGMTQKELSDLTKIAAPSLNECLAGKRGFNAVHIVKIALVLGLDAIELGRMQSDYEIMQVINPIVADNFKEG